MILLQWRSQKFSVGEMKTQENVIDILCRQNIIKNLLLLYKKNCDYKE